MKKKSFEEIYDNYYLKVYYYILKKINNYYDAEDLTQEVFVACYKNYKRYDSNKAKLSTWIYVIANNRLKNYYRNKKNNISIDNEENLIEIQDERCIEEAMILEEQKEILFETMNKLSIREQLIIKAKYFNDKNSNEIANDLGISPTNVRKILERALAKIQLYFEKIGYEIRKEN